MKIVTEKAIYVQKVDIDRLCDNDVFIPYSILHCGITIDENTKYEFVKFDKEEDINYFNSIDWIMDYDELKKLSNEEIINMWKSMKEEKEKITQQYETMKSGQNDEVSKMIRRSLSLHLKTWFLTEFLSFRYGDLEMPLPEEIESQVKTSQKQKQKTI